MLLHLEAGIDGEDVTVPQGLAELSAEPAAVIRIVPTTLTAW